MREQVLDAERFDTIIGKAAKEAGYSEGFGLQGCDLTQAHWWAAYARQAGKSRPTITGFQSIYSLAPKKLES